MLDYFTNFSSDAKKVCSEDSPTKGMHRPNLGHCVDGDGVGGEGRGGGRGRPVPACVTQSPFKFYLLV